MRKVESSKTCYFSTSAESGEVGALTIKASSLNQMELNGSMRQITITSFFKEY